MQDKQDVLSKLEQMLVWKKSKAFYASKLGISEQEVTQLLEELREDPQPNPYLEDIIKEVNNEKGTLKSSIELNYEPKDDIELAALHKIDLKKYKISTYWSKLKSNGKFTSSVLATLRLPNDKDAFSTSFLEYLSKVQPSKRVITRTYSDHKPKIALILPKQDAHFDKYDIKGDNDIDKRFNKNQLAIVNMLNKAISTNALEEVIYIVGSDQFNSEWTQMTTKGTPQTNLLPYQDSFKLICDHEVEVINTLLHYSPSVKVMYIPGNHDEYVGWHLVHWLESYFKSNPVTFDTSTDNTKYLQYNNTAIMLNHGDAIKPKELAQKFPIGFRDKWSQCENFIIITGDKHHELSLDIHGIKFYQIPQLSSARSKWDDKQGYIDNKAEMTSFVISEKNGITDIYKEIL